MGWIHRKWGKEPLLLKFEKIYDSHNFRKIAIPCYSILFAVGCIGLCTVSEQEHGNASFSNLPAGASAIYSLVNGDAKTYDKELTERNEYLSTTPEVEVKVKPLSAIPEVIFHSNITTDPFDWHNQHLGLYYDKPLIWIEE